MDQLVDHYEINISKGGQHWGKVILPSYPESDAIKKLHYMRSIFGSDFNITMIRWESRGIHKAAWEE